jgi:transposase
METRKPYPSDVTDDGWPFAAPCLALVREDAPPRRHDLREVFNALRYLIRTGAPWRYLPTNFPPWAAVYQQTRRWLAADVFERRVTPPPPPGRLRRPPRPARGCRRRPRCRR